MDDIMWEHFQEFLRGDIEATRTVCKRANCCRFHSFNCSTRIAKTKTDLYSERSLRKDIGVRSWVTYDSCSHRYQQRSRSAVI